MAGIGIKLSNIYKRKAIISQLLGIGYSTAVTIAPMLIVIITIYVMMQFLGFSDIGYTSREIFACTILYMFIFSVLATSPLNAVLSKYLSDVIYEEKYEDIMSCYNIGLLLNIIIACGIAIPFCLREYFIGHVDILLVFVGFCGFIGLVLVLYTMIYLAICKDYAKISKYYFIGMIFVLVLSFFFRYFLNFECTFSMLLALAFGFNLIACLEYATLKTYFRKSSKNYKMVLQYIKTFWMLIAANTAYILGLFSHNFVFWFSDLRLEVVKTFICAEPYDMASCLAMMTSISASVIFISRVEMYFHKKYKDFTEAVIGGRWSRIQKTKENMFSELASQLMDITRIQFIVSILVYLIFIITLPRFGFSGMVMRIYPCLAAGYFILFLMYSSIIFLYYYDDLFGSLLTSVVFLVVTTATSILAMNLSEIWYGVGVFIGALAGWGTAYKRLRWIEKNMDIHIFGRGEILRRGLGYMPSSMVYSKNTKKSVLKFFTK